MAIDKNSVMNEARKFAARGLYDKAIAEWKKLLNESPHDANLFNTIGDLCIKKNSRAEAVDAYKRAADILADDGFTSKAIALYKKILNIDINRIEVHLALGDMHAEKGLTGNALQNYKFAADFYKKENKIAEALGIYQKMADLDPSNVAFRIKLADMYAKERMTAEAVSSYLAAADVHLSKGAIKEARHLFEKVLAIDPDNRAVYHKAGVAYLKEGKFNEACKALKPAFESDPDNRELSDAYFEALTKAGKSGDAERVITKILAAAPDRTDLHEKLYDLYIAGGNFEKALATASSLSQFRVEQGDRSGAEEILKKFVAASPSSLPGWRALAELYISFGRGQDAADAYMDAAKARSEEGDVEGAVAALNRALEIVPDFQEARVLLERLSSSVSPPAELSGEPAEEPSPELAGRPEDEKAETPALELAAGPEVESVEAPSPELATEPEQEAEKPAPAVLETPPAGEEFPAAPAAEQVAEVRTAEEKKVDPAVAEALLEADVLVKYGLAAKAIEQLEGLVKKFPESTELRFKLRDLHGDQGQMRKAADHMLAVADLYRKRGMEDEAEQVLRSALDMDPSNAEVSARLGVSPAPASAGLVALTPPEPAPTAFEDFPPSEDLSGKAAEPASETMGPSEETPFPEPAPTGEIVLEGLESGFSQEAEPSVTAEPPVDETPSTETALSAGGKPAVGAFGIESGPLETGRDVLETMSRADEGPGSPTVPEERAAKADVNELWAEAEFYFQQGLFHEAKKHYARIIQMNPGERKAIERLEELSREVDEIEEFAKLAEAVEELEAAPPPDAHSGPELPLSKTDEEAVRSLMKEISQLKQPLQRPAPPEKEEASSAPSRPEAPPERLHPAGPPQKAFDAAGHTKPGKEEDYFDLGAELAADSRQASAEQEKEHGDFFDLASELRDELSEDTAPQAASDEEQSLDDIFEEFKQGMEKHAAKEDEDTHYNLGVAYREMGLLDDAITEFIMTPDGEPKFIQSRYMLGLCYMEKGDYRRAAGEIQNAMNYSEATGVATQNLIGMHYDLGYAFQGAGNTLGALREFQIVQNLDPHYRDIAEKIKELRKGEFVSLDQLKDDIEKEISEKFLEEDKRIEREEKNRKNEKVRS